MKKIKILHQKNGQLCLVIVVVVVMLPSLKLNKTMPGLR